MEGKLIVSYRGKLAVMSGRVTSVTENGPDTVCRIENGAAADVAFRTDLCRKMKVAAGSVIMASVEKSFRLEILASGGNVKDTTPIRGKYFCYSGVMEFSRTGKLRPENIFFGTVADISNDGAGVRYRIMYWNNGRNVSSIVLDRAGSSGLQKGQRAVMVTSGNLGDCFLLETTYKI